MMEIKGKRGRKVPIILTEEMKDSIGLQIKTRKAVGIPDANTHMSSPELGASLWITFEDGIASDNLHLNAILHSLIQMLSRAQNCENTSQLYHKCSHENEVDWLARHLGHDVMVHREFCFWLWMAAKSASGRENVLMKSTLMVSILKHLLLLNLFFYF